MISSEDARELRHIADGGKFCLDGRKERKLLRLKLLSVIEGRCGFKVTNLGMVKLLERESLK